MVDAQVFGWGMYSLGLAYNREVTQDLRDLYAAVADELSTEQFQAAIHELLRAEDREFFPPPGKILEAGYRLTKLSESLALPPPQRDREREREEAKKGMELIKAEWRKRYGEEIDAGR